ncbi:MAG TPA: GNAT family N-acetyltransferase [Cyclobacteriaceae bacterium]|jgi:GNAT superfamily N-acetyltransferase
MNNTIEVVLNDYVFSSEKSRIDVGYVHRYLAERSYWAKGIPVDTVRASIANSLCVGIYKDGQQVGFGRLITDYATFGYLADVFVDEGHRGNGLSKKLVELILSYQPVKKLRRLMLGTVDAHGLYGRYGFTPLKHPERFMEIHRPDIYH